MLRAKDLWKQEEERKTAKMQAMRPVLSNLSSQLKLHAIQNPQAPYFVCLDTLSTTTVKPWIMSGTLYSNRDSKSG